MSEEAREAARRIVAEVFATQQGAHRAAPAEVAGVPTSGPVGDAPRDDDSPLARRARALVAAVFDPPGALQPVGQAPGPTSEPVVESVRDGRPDAAPEMTPAVLTPAQMRARELVEEAAAAQTSFGRQQDEDPVGPRSDLPSSGSQGQDEATEVVERELFAARDCDDLAAEADDRLFARVDLERERPPERRDLPPSLAEDVEGPPPPPVRRVEPAQSAGPVGPPEPVGPVGPPEPVGPVGPPEPVGPAAVLDRQPPSVPAAPVAEPPRADLAARLVSELLEERDRPAAHRGFVARSATEDHATQQLEEEEPQGAARWLVVTAIGAVTLALLLPLAVAAVRELLALS